MSYHWTNCASLPRDHPHIFVGQSSPSFSSTVVIITPCLCVNRCAPACDGFHNQCMGQLYNFPLTYVRQVVRAPLKHSFPRGLASEVNGHFEQNQKDGDLWPHHNGTQSTRTLYFLPALHLSAFLAWRNLSSHRRGPASDIPI